MSEPKTLNPDRWVEAHSDVLYRYAISRVSKPHVAEDLVQETFLAGYKSRHAFSGRSTERTWLVGILKHKIMDYYRKSKREALTEDLELTEATEAVFLDPKGHWKTGLNEWLTHPGKATQQEEFFIVLQRCMAKLSSRYAEVFERKELQGESPKNICDEMGLSASNLWVMLHRARLQLKTCLTTHWLDPQSENS